MSKKPVSPLRQRLIDDITARRFSEDTKRDYVRNVRKFAAFLGRSPDTATSEDLRRYQLHPAGGGDVWMPKFPATGLCGAQRDFVRREIRVRSRAAERACGRSRWAA